MKKNSTFRILIWFLLIYLWVNWILFETSNNTSIKEFTYVNKAVAKLNFYQDSWYNTEYSKGPDVLEAWKWSSSEYPEKDLYNKVYVTWENSIQISPVTVSIINTIRHSH